MKKLLFITTRVFWPTDSGRKYSLYHYCRGLHEKYGYEIYLYSFLEDYSKLDYNPYPWFIKELKTAKKVGKFTKILNLFTKSLFCKWPFQNSILYSKKNKKLIGKYVCDIKPDVIMVDMIRLAPYIKSFYDYKCIKILDYDDLLSERYKKQVITKNNEGDLFGAFSSKKSLKSKLVNCRFLKMIILKSEMKRIAYFEKKYANLYDNAIFVSDHETMLFNQKNKTDKGITIRVGVDYNYYANFNHIIKKDGYLAFMGNLKYSANFASLKIIVERILPNLDFNYKLIVVGNVTEEIKREYSNSKIIFTGRIDDFRPVLKECEMFISPIAYGSGIKTKIIEAISLGLPVVTNNLGIEGIDDYRDVSFVTDEFGEMSNYINKLHKDKNLADEISANGLKLIIDNYQWNVIFENFKKIKL